MPINEHFVPNAGVGPAANLGGIDPNQLRLRQRRPPYIRPVSTSRKGIRVAPPTVLLNGSNTDSWKLAVRPYLIFTGVDHYIKNVRAPDMDCPSYPLWAKDELDNVAVLLSLIEPQYQSRFADCTTAKQLWDMAMAESSSLVVRVSGIFRQWSNFNPMTMTPRVFVNNWSAALSSFRQCGNNWNLESQLAMILQNFPPSMNDIRNTMSAPGAFSTLQVALQRLYDLLENHHNPNGQVGGQQENVVNAVYGQPNPNSGRGRGGKNPSHHQTNRGGQLSRGGGQRSGQPNYVAHGGRQNQNFSGSRIGPGGGTGSASGLPTCTECGIVGHFRPGCPNVVRRRNKRPNAGSDSSNSVARNNTNQTPSASVSSLNNKNSSAYLLSWLLDSGASRHCSFNRDLFINFEPFRDDCFVQVASGQTLKVMGVGDINLALPKGGVLNIKSVWHVPELKENVLSIFRLAILGLSIAFFSDKARIYDVDGQCLFVIRAREGIYSLFTGTCIDSVLSVCIKEKTSKAMLWHLRLGHLNVDQLRIILNRMGIKCPASLECVTCLKRKIASSPHNRRLERSTQVLQLIHSDICGPVRIASNSIKYFVTFIDDFSRMVFVYGLRLRYMAILPKT